MVVGALESIQFFRQNTWFLENKGALYQSLHGILHYLISITRLWKKSLPDTQFYINHVKHLI